MSKRTIKPVAGKRVRFPDNRLLIEETDVEWNSHWQRLEREGDIEVVEPKGTKKPKAGAPTVKE